MELAQLLVTLPAFPETLPAHCFPCSMVLPLIIKLFDNQEVTLFVPYPVPYPKHVFATTSHHQPMFDMKHGSQVFGIGLRPGKAIQYPQDPEPRLTKVAGA